MAKIKGILIMIPPILIAFVEIYYLIILPLQNEGEFKITQPQYWALAIPTVLAMVVFSLVAIWIGYTMIVTPEPIRLTYEEAYEEALNITETMDSNEDKDE